MSKEKQMSEGKTEIPKKQYALDSTAMPSPYTFEYSHIRSKVHEIIDGKTTRRDDVQGISFLADDMRLVGQSGEGNLISTKYELDGVASSIICIATAHHVAPTTGSELHIEVMPEEGQDIGQRIHLVLHGFKTISVGMGISIDDLFVDINYNMYGGRGTMVVRSKIPEKKDE